MCIAYSINSHWPTSVVGFFIFSFFLHILETCKTYRKENKWHNELHVHKCYQPTAKLLRVASQPFPTVPILASDYFNTKSR